MDALFGSLLLIDYHLQCLSRIILNMRGDIAEVCKKNLKRNDFIYVSGHLESYTKIDQNGKPILCYKVHRADYFFF